MINGKVPGIEIPQHVINIHNEDDTQDEKHHKNSPGSTIKNKYYDSGTKTAEDDQELIPVNESGSPEWTSGPKGVAFTVVYLVICIAILVFCMNFVHLRMPLNAPPLPDLGHELIPKMEPEKLGDMTMMIQIVMTIIAVATNPNRWPILIRFLLTLGNLYLLRVVSILSTSMPPTENHCRFNFPKISNIWYNTFMGVITLGSSNIHCGDLMFSGHTCMITNCWMTFHTNYKKHYILRIVTTLLLIITMIFIIGTRSHYTVDVWIAFWLTALVHKATPRRFPFTKNKIRNFFKHF